MPNGFPPPNQHPAPSGAPNPGSTPAQQQPGTPAMPQQPAYPAAQPPQGMPPQQQPYPGMPQQPYQGGAQQSYPGPAQQPAPYGYAGQPNSAPGHPGQMGSGAAQTSGGLKYDAAGKPKYPAPYLAAIIVLGIGLAFSLFSVMQSFSSVGDVAAVLGDDHELTGKIRVLAWLTLATVIVNAAAFVGIVLGMAWGRIVYPVMFVINIIAVLIVFAGLGGINVVDVTSLISLILPILVIVALWVPISTQYLKAMAQWRQRQQGVAPAF